MSDAQRKLDQPVTDDQPVDPLDLRPPSIALDGLFAAISDAWIFPDAKAAADAVPDEAPSEILEKWRKERDEPGFDLKRFADDHFHLPPIPSAVRLPHRGKPVREYIDLMWDVLTRPPDKRTAWSSLLALPERYVVPGGRFTEIYYWDSYFTMIGLDQSDRTALMRSMIEDFASLITRYGHIPNGNRTYYLSRSQPPFFSLMIDLLAAREGSSVYTEFLPELQREHDYWLNGAETLEPGHAWRHLVRLPDGTTMIRHWDDLDTPRDESHIEDITTARETTRPSSELWRDLRAGAETGWDYSSRWLEDGRTLATIHTTDILPIEVNCLVAHLEQTLAHAYTLAGDTNHATLYNRMASERRAAILRVFWNAKDGAFHDFDWKRGQFTEVLSTATAVPLFLHMATPEQAAAVAHTLREKLLKPGGLVSTDRTTGEQWDAPNGWAPQQWMAVKGLETYGEHALAAEIARRWMARVIGNYAQSGVLLEKYDVVETGIHPDGGGGSGGGEYPMQAGFGWTNGTLLGLMNAYPDSIPQPE